MTFSIGNNASFSGPHGNYRVRVRNSALPAPPADTVALILAPAHPPADVIENGPLAVSVVSGDTIPLKLSVIYKHNAFAYGGCGVGL